MPFCRKCGRRLVEYSEVCTDCGQSTTSPIINTKRIQPSQTTGTLNKKIAKAIIPDMVPVQIKVIVDKPAKAAVAHKVAASPVQAIAKPKAAPVKVVTPVTLPPVKIAPAKAIEAPKPVLSAKHIVKPKKAAQTKPLAPFTLTHARPVAGLEIPQRRAVAPKQVTQLKPVVVEKTVAEHKIAKAAAPVAAPAPVVEPLPVIQVTPFAVTVEPPPPPKPKPVPAATQIVVTQASPTTPAPVYPPHEIIQSKVSIKEDILAHPEDYEKEAFEFDLRCHNGHLFKEGTMLPVSKGKAYCPQCGERLNKPRPKKRRYRRRTYLH